MIQEGTDVDNTRGLILLCDDSTTTGDSIVVMNPHTMQGFFLLFGSKKQNRVVCCVVWWSASSSYRNFYFGDTLHGFRERAGACESEKRDRNSQIVKIVAVRTPRRKRGDDPVRTTSLAVCPTTPSLAHGWYQRGSSWGGGEAG